MKTYTHLTSYQRTLLLSMKQPHRPTLEPYGAHRVRIDWTILTGWLAAGVITFSAFYLAIQIARFAWERLSAVLAMAGLS